MMDALDSVLLWYGKEIWDDMEDFSEIEGGHSWRLSPIWTSWLTHLDGGTIAFYSSETHSDFTLTGMQDYICARLIGSTMTVSSGVLWKRVAIWTILV